MQLVDDIGATGNAGETVTVVAPCVRDVPGNPLTATSTLADIENSGYRLRRIVGKIWCGVTSAGANGGPGMLTMCAGFIVLRCDESGIPLAPSANDHYNSLIIENTENPWIWRRSWLVGNPAEGADASFFNSQSQTNNTDRHNVRIGGVADGPHVDAKTARIVGPDERLFLVLSTMVLNQGDVGINATIKWVWDCRYLASMRSMVGNRRNASR